MAKKQISDLSVASLDDLNDNCSFIIDKSDRSTRKVSLGTLKSALCGSGSGGLIDIDKIETLQSIEISYGDVKDITLQYDSVIQIQLPTGYYGYECIRLWIKKNDSYLYLDKGNNALFCTLRFKSGTTIRIRNLSAYESIELNCTINLLPIS